MIGALISLLSLNMTERLVAAGIVATTLTVAGATNATPIVVDTGTAHGLIRPAHGVVSGVVGNGAANGTWVLTPTDTTHLSLSTYTLAGASDTSTGDGNYVSGGTIRISFPDGSILLGRRNVAMQSAVATPRIVFIPIGSQEWTLDPYGGVIPAGVLPRTLASQTTEQKTMKLQRQLNTERQRFEVHVTGSSVPSDPDFGDFDVTQALYQTLYAVMFDVLSPDRAKVTGGRWVSQTPDIQTLDTRGQKWVGTVEISQPVTDNPLAFLPTSTDGTLTVNFASGASADQTVIVVPVVH